MFLIKYGRHNHKHCPHYKHTQENKIRGTRTHRGANTHLYIKTQKMTEDEFPTARYTILHCPLNKTRGLSHVWLNGFPVLINSYSLTTPAAPYFSLWHYRIFGGKLIKGKYSNIQKDTTTHTHIWNHLLTWRI